jgi:hemerythrin-like domain-containing protein
MAMAAADARRPAHEQTIKALPPALLDEPLEYIFADHFRQRSICAALKGFADRGHVPRADAGAISTYLDQDLTWHHQDEDDDLFPSLRRRALPEDALDEPLAQLGKDHSQSAVTVGRIVEALGAAPDDGAIRLSPQMRELMSAYCADENRHIAIENGIVLAIARIRLTKADIRSMSRSMKLRRGIAP